MRVALDTRWRSSHSREENREFIALQSTSNTNRAETDADESKAVLVPKLELQPDELCTAAPSSGRLDPLRLELDGAAHSWTWASPSQSCGDVSDSPAVTASISDTPSQRDVMKAENQSEQSPDCQETDVAAYRPRSRSTSQSSEREELGSASGRDTDSCSNTASSSTAAGAVTAGGAGPGVKEEEEEEPAGRGELLGLERPGVVSLLLGDAPEKMVNLVFRGDDIDDLELDSSDGVSTGNQLC